MWVRMLTTAAGPEGVYLAGHVYEVPDAQVTRWVQLGVCMPLAAVVGMPVAPEYALDPAPPAAEKRGKKGGHGR